MLYNFNLFFFNFAKAYVKNSISKFNLHFYFEWYQGSFHMIESQFYFLFCKLSVHSPYYMLTELLDFGYYL